MNDSELNEKVATSIQPTESDLMISSKCPFPSSDYTSQPTEINHRSSVGSVESVESTEPTESAEINHPSSTELTDPTEINHPSSVESNEPNEPTEPTELTKINHPSPTEPTEITHPSPTEPTEITHPSPTKPTEPTQQSEKHFHPSDTPHSSFHNNNTYLLVMCISTDSQVLFLFFSHSRH